MRPSQRVILPVWVGVMSVAGFAVLFFAVQQPESAVRAGGIALGFWFPAVATLLGTLIALRQPGNRMAWLLMGIGFAVLIEFFLQLFLSTEPTSPSTLDVAAIVLVHIALPTAIYLTYLVPLVFPNGRFFTRWHALAAWPGAIMLFIPPLTVLLTEEVGLPFPPEGQAWTIGNPIGVFPTYALRVAIASTIVALALTAAAGVFSLAVRYRRSSLVVKAQIRWMLFSVVVVAGVFLSLVVTGISQSAAGGLLMMAAFVNIPISITVAITRYRLFEIDRIISRTITYAAVVAILGLVFVAGVAWVPSALGLEDSPLVVAGSTLAVAAAFNPLRRRARNTIDRRFNRSGYRAEVISEEFASRLRESLTTAQIIEEWRRTVGESLQPETSGVWINHRSVGRSE